MKIEIVSEETDEQVAMIEAADDFDADGELEIGISMDDSDNYDAYIHLKKEKVLALVDHLIEVLNK